MEYSVLELGSWGFIPAFDQEEPAWSEVETDPASGEPGDLPSEHSALNILTEW